MKAPRTTLWPGKIGVFPVILIALCCLQKIAHSQELEFEHYDVSHGISQSVILDIYQDSEGYMWFGTQSGLNRFDGYEFQVFNSVPYQPGTITNTWIYDITEGPDGSLYVTTKGGLNLYRKSDGIFIPIPHKEDGSVVADNFVYGLDSDEKNLYLNTPPNLVIMDIQSGDFTTWSNGTPYSGVLSDLGVPIRKISEDYLLMGSRQGLHLFNLKTQKFTSFRHNPYTQGSIPHDHVLCLFPDDNGLVLIGTENGICLFNTNTLELDPLNKLNMVISNPFVRDIYRDSRGSLWIATEGGGLNRIILGQDYSPINVRHLSQEKNFISHDIVYSLCEDQSGNLWAGTLAGIDKTDLKESQLKVYRKSEDPNSVDLLDNFIAAIYRKEDQLWIGNWGKGLNLLNPETGNIQHFHSGYSGYKKIP